MITWWTAPPTLSITVPFILLSVAENVILEDFNITFFKINFLPVKERCVQHRQIYESTTLQASALMEQKLF